jgi:hypothetical protein
MRSRRILRRYPVPVSQPLQFGELVLVLSRPSHQVAAGTSRSAIAGWRLGPCGGSLTALGPVDYLLLLADLLVEVCCLLFLFRRRAFSQHFTLVLYLSSSIAIGIGRYGIIKTAGFTSNAYLYFYFYSDALLTICMYFVLMSLYSHMFSDMGVSKFVRGGAMLLLAGTAGISYHMVAASTDRLITHFVIELGQNLYFVGVLLTYLLWGAMVKLRENRTRLIQLVLSIGVFLSAFAGSYALGNLYPSFALWRYFFPLLNMWLPLSWAYTFMKVPEDARMATANVLAPNR